MKSATASLSPIEVMMSTPMTAAGTEPMTNHFTNSRLTVLRRRWTAAPTGFMNSETTRSLLTAVTGSMPKKRMRIGVIRAPPPIPVSPTTKPTRMPARTRPTPRVMKPRSRS